MDLRITNACTNNCLYCLEQTYRVREKCIKKDIILADISENRHADDIITFYWWNPLLHPDLWEILNFCRNRWFASIWILTNTHSLNKDALSALISKGLNSIWFYFNSFDEHAHARVVNGWISLNELLLNLEHIKKSWIFYKAIIHINRQNIEHIYQDICILNKKYWVKHIEFINYFPFDRPYDDFREMLEYSTKENRNNIDRLLKMISKLGLRVNFVKFPRNFFGNYDENYDFTKWILEQIWDEDRERLRTTEKPFCYTEYRCTNCFIKDNCEFYDGEI